MYEQHYHFTEKPFGLTPDPKYLYASHSHAKALATLQQAIARRRDTEQIDLCDSVSLWPGSICGRIYLTSSFDRYANAAFARAAVGSG